MTYGKARNGFGKLACARFVKTKPFGSDNIVSVKFKYGFAVNEQGEGHGPKFGVVLIKEQAVFAAFVYQIRVSVDGNGIRVLPPYNGKPVYVVKIIGIVGLFHAFNRSYSDYVGLVAQLFERGILIIVLGNGRRKPRVVVCTCTYNREQRANEQNHQ